MLGFLLDLDLEWGCLYETKRFKQIRFSDDYDYSFISNDIFKVGVVDMNIGNLIAGICGIIFGAFLAKYRWKKFEEGNERIRQESK